MAEVRERLEQHVNEFWKRVGPIARRDRAIQGEKTKTAQKAVKAGPLYQRSLRHTRQAIIKMMEAEGRDRREIDAAERFMEKIKFNKLGNSRPTDEMHKYEVSLELHQNQRAESVLESMYSHALALKTKIEREKGRTSAVANPLVHIMRSIEDAKEFIDAPNRDEGLRNLFRDEIEDDTNAERKARLLAFLDRKK